MPFTPRRTKAPLSPHKRGGAASRWSLRSTLARGRVPHAALAVFASIFESLLPLPKHHSQTAQDLVKKSTLNPGTGGSNEKAISRKRSARRLGLGDAGGIRCRNAGAGIYTAATAPSGLHLERLLYRRQRGY